MVVVLAKELVDVDVVVVVLVAEAGVPELWRLGCSLPWDGSGAWALS